MDTVGDSRCVAVFDRHEDHRVGFFSSGHQVKFRGEPGAFWGSIFGILLAPAFYCIPCVGPTRPGGLIGSATMGTRAGAGVGASELGAKDLQVHAR